MENEFNALAPVDGAEFLLSLEVLQCCVLLDDLTSKPYALKKVSLSLKLISYYYLLSIFLLLFQDGVGICLRRISDKSIQPTAVTTICALLNETPPALLADLFTKEQPKQLLNLIVKKEIDIKKPQDELAVKILASISGNEKGSELIKDVCGAEFLALLGRFKMNEIGSDKVVEMILESKS